MKYISFSRHPGVISDDVVRGSVQHRVGRVLDAGLVHHQPGRHRGGRIWVYGAAGVILRVHRLPTTTVHAGCHGWGE